MAVVEDCTRVACVDPKTKHVTLFCNKSCAANFKAKKPKKTSKLRCNAILTHTILPCSMI